MASEYVATGSIILDGKEIPGYIKHMGFASLGDDMFEAPWEYQNQIRFIEKNAFETATKLKNKDYEKYDAGDIDGYKYGDSLRFESVEYADMSAVGTGMIAKKMFMRKVSDGKISLYLHYPSPIIMGEMSTMIESYIESANPNHVYRIGKEGKLKLVSGLNIKKELADCPAVVEKYEKGDYGDEGDHEEKSRLAKLAEKTILREDIRLAVIDDYNNLCK